MRPRIHLYVDYGVTLSVAEHVAKESTVAVYIVVENGEILREPEAIGVIAPIP
jgi:hypothetical protein